MALIQYQLVPAYSSSYSGGTITVDPSRSYNVGTNLTAGGGTLNIDDTDTALVFALDNYPALRRVGSTADAAPTLTQIQRRSFTGAYTIGARYLTGMEATYQGDCWICTTDHTATSTFDKTKWITSAKGTGGELAYAESTTNTGSLSNTSYSAIPNLPSITFDLGDDPIILELYLPMVQVGVAATVLDASIWDQTLAMRAFTEWYPGVQFATSNIVLRRRIAYPTLAKGTYTMTGYTRVSGTSASYAINPATAVTPIALSARKA